MDLLIFRILTGRVTLLMEGLRVNTWDCILTSIAETSAVQVGMTVSPLDIVLTENKLEVDDIICVSLGGASDHPSTSGAVISKNES